jgi:hypothetical protein
MTINNKDLYRLYSNIKHYDKAIYYGTCGLFIEGFSGGINAYATDGKAVYRKTFSGDNKEIFTAYFDDWQRKDGATDTKNLKSASDDYNKNALPKIKEYFDRECFNAIAVNASEFKKAVKAVDAINRGEGNHDIILSFHNSEFSLASWNGFDNGDTALWQIDGVYEGNGAVKINRKYFDGVKSEKKPMELSFMKMDYTALCVKSAEFDAVIMPKEIDAEKFLEVFEYEYKAPVKPELKLVIAEKPQNEPVKKARKPVKPRLRKANGAFTGWTYNRLGTKQIKVLNW